MRRGFVLAFIGKFWVAAALWSAPYLVTVAAERSSQIAQRAEHSLLLDAAVAGDSVIAVGERGHVLKSSDQGRSWRQIVVPTRVMLTAVDFFDAEHGFVVGHEAVILRTQDGGNSWQRVHQAGEEDRPLLDVVAHDQRTITAIGAYGYYLVSEDGGRSWDTRLLLALDRVTTAADAQTGEGLADDLHLNQIAVADSGRWYIAAEAGIIYRSDNQGQDWLRLPSPHPASFFGVLPLAQDQVLIVGMQGQMFYSDDAGDRWQPIATRTSATLTHALGLGDGTVVVTGHSGSILLTNKGRQAFELIRLPQRMAISAAAELTDGHLLLVGTGGAVRWTPRDLRR